MVQVRSISYSTRRRKKELISLRGTSKRRKQIGEIPVERTSFFKGITISALHRPLLATPGRVLDKDRVGGDPRTRGPQRMNARNATNRNRSCVCLGGERPRVTCHRRWSDVDTSIPATGVRFLCSGEGTKQGTVAGLNALMSWTPAEFCHPLGLCHDSRPGGTAGIDQWEAFPKSVRCLRLLSRVNPSTVVVYRYNVEERNLSNIFLCNNLFIKI